MNSTASSRIRHAVVLAHPDANSFNAAIAHAYCETVRAAGQEAILRDANVVTFIFPIWFGMPPAMLVGYIDRVLGAGTTIRQVQDRSAEGPLGKGHLCAITTSGASADWLEAQGQTEALRELAGTYLFRAFAMRSSEALHIGDVVEGASSAFIQDNLQRVRKRAASICARVGQELYGTPLPPQMGDGS